jgi:lipopolysaccharide/colanic/teichoic acid biosynthesis glycosyltransferase
MTGARRAVAGVRDRDDEARRAALASRNEMSGPVLKIRDDPRITPVGWNVLAGDMSLVGPRGLTATPLGEHEFKRSAASHSCQRQITRGDSRTPQP